MHSNIFLDESGDLGWTFNKPYRQGGSSRFLTIAYLICPSTHINIPRRFVRDFYKKYNFNPKDEIKASELKSHHKDFICQETLKMMAKYPNFLLGSITVKKSNVAIHLQSDGNKLYNYMIGLSAVEKVLDHTTCKLTRDVRSVKVASGNSCIDYLQILVWFHKNKPLQLTDNPTHSHHEDGIIFIDWVTNIVWSKYEDNYPNWCNQLDRCLTEKRLFF